MMPWKVVIADRGWVFVARVHRDGDRLILQDAYNVRRWGTTEGIGQLALNGPLAATALDFYGSGSVHVLAVCGGEWECDQAVWSKWFAKQSQAKKR